MSGKEKQEILDVLRGFYRKLKDESRRESPDWRYTLERLASELQEVMSALDSRPATEEITAASSALYRADEHLNKALDVIGELQKILGPPVQNAEEAKR